MYTLKSAPHKADPTYTVHLNEREADYDREAAYEVAVTKEGFPPHSVETFLTLSEAEARFQQLTSC